LIIAGLPTGATTTLSFFAESEFGTSEPVAIDVFIKGKKGESLVAPVLSIGGCATSFNLANDFCLLPEKTVANLTWSSVAGASDYIFYSSSTYQEFGKIRTEQREIPLTLDQLSASRLLREKEVAEYRLVARSSKGVTTTSSVVKVASYRSAPIILSELGPNFSSSSPADSYLELENTTGLLLAPLGLALASADGSFNLPLVGSVLPRAFFLVANAPESLILVDGPQPGFADQVTAFTLPAYPVTYRLMQGGNLWSETTVAPTLFCATSADHSDCLAPAETYTGNAAQLVDGTWRLYPYQDFPVESLRSSFPMIGYSPQGELIMGTPGRENVYPPRPV
jgi:hypothetical protein